MEIITLPVWSRLAPEEAVPPEVRSRCPVDIRLSSHQLETYKALVEGNADVIFNTAMTGDGKSLAGQLPVLIHDWRSPVLAMYPTNELIRDQESQLRGSQQKWRSELTFGTLNSHVLDGMMSGRDVRRGDALMDALRNCDAVITNPDIFHLIMHQFYLWPEDARDKIIGPMVQKFGQMIFDEFHIFDVAQVISVLNALLLLDEMSGSARRPRYLFLSATPDKLMLEYLQRSGLSVQQIEGCYEHSEAELEPSQWRRILHRTTIHFERLRAEEWVAQHLDDVLLPFFEDHRPGAKGAIIVNSVAAAKRLVATLKPAFQARGLTVEENTGFTSRTRRQDSYSADLLVGTSTVDVGVDFQINLLVFESRDAGTFLQRLGRLGRHQGFERNGTFHPFQEFVAYALVPPWIEEAFFQGRDGSAPLLEPGNTVDRAFLGDAVRQAYPPVARFDAYARLWGALQTARIMCGLNHKTISEAYRDTRMRLGRRYEETFGIRIRAAYGRRKELATSQLSLLQEAESFRGGSHFVCCVLDQTETGRERYKTADLLQMAANADLAVLEDWMFYAAVERDGLSKGAFERWNPLAFFVLRGWRPEREDYRFWLDQDIRSWGDERFGKAMALKGFRLDAGLPGINALNNRLARRAIPALLLAGVRPREVMHRLRLPMLFALHAFTSRDGVEGCVAFGRDALLLEARLAQSTMKGGGGAIIL